MTAPVRKSVKGCVMTLLRNRLPDPLDYFSRREGLILQGRGRWRSARCPFHDDSHPSLRVDTASGAFKCMACGVHGGDVLEFHRQLHGLGFVAAARDLDAWGAP